jgi:A/G-specific adenine glycosylase
MLQQTQVARVIGKYREFIRRFPDPGSLASAPLSEVLKLWQGLGYNRRALLLKKLAETVAGEYAGKIPSDRRSLRGLPGIGEATSGAICAFAFNQPELFIETNIRSVFLHHFFRDKTGVSDRQLMPFVARAMDTKNPRQWYSALMDYGVYLKETLPNPSRQSSHYSRQSRFAGSDRQIRAAIVRLLLKKPLTLTQCKKALGVDIIRLRRIASALVKDRLIVRQRTRFAIAE